MDKNSIDCAILSVSAPSLTIIQDKDEANKLAREINSYAASLRDQHPSRFGFFTTLPALTDIPACLSEIEYSFDRLGAEGVTLLTSYNGRYLGHPDFGPLWAELNKRSAVVFVHPSQGAVPQLSEPAMPGPMIDFPHETTRTAVSMIIGNVVRDNPNVKIILSHAGGTLPYMATRVAYQVGGTPFVGNRTAGEFLDDAKKFYFDLALSAYDGPFELLKKFAGSDHITYGSDFPFAKPDSIKMQAEFVKSISSNDDRETGEERGVQGEDGFKIRRESALGLFPQLADRLKKGAVNGLANSS